MWSQLMFRSALGLLLFLSCYSLAENTPPPSPPATSLIARHAELKTDIAATTQRVDKLQASWENSTSKMTRDLIQQQINADIRNTTQQVDNFLKQVETSKTPESIGLAEDVIKTENTFFKARLTTVSSDLNQLFEQYDKSGIDEQLLILFNINDFYAYINWLLNERLDNLHLLQSWQVNMASEQQQFNQEISRYADFMATYLQNNTRQKELLQAELKSLPADARSSLEAKVAAQDRLVRSAVNNLKQLVPMLEEQKLPVDRYNELIFKTTGNLAEAVVDIGTMRTVVSGFSSDLLEWFKANIGSLFSRLFLFAALMGGAIMLARLVRQIITRAVTHKKARFSTLVQQFFINAGGNLVVVFGILFALAQVGLDLTPVLTGLGVAGIVVGFALQDTLSNFASGMMILIYRPFDVGDFVEAGGVSGKVGKMSLVNTTIRTFDNQVFMVPNAKIWGETIKNITSERIRRVDMVFGVAYGDDIAKVETILEEIVISHPKILKNPEHIIRLQLLNESSVDFIVRPWVKTDDYWDVYWDITREVKVRFDREGITIPFPQREIMVRSETTATDLAERVSIEQLDSRELTMAER